MGFLIRSFVFFTSKIKSVFSNAAEASMQNNFPGGFNDKMMEREALLILNAKISDDAQTLRDKHRRLIVINHPDKGGSTFLCSKINEAKDMLVKDETM